MNFQQLRSVREAARRGFNLTDVAAMLHTSQPGVSRQIRELEEELGVEIFVRAGKRLTGLTPPGEVLLPTVERLLLEAENLRRAGQDFSASAQGRLSIAAMDAWVWIPFVMILLLAGLQALPHEIKEAARVDGAGAWQGFWEITFPLMLPVSITAIVLRIIFQLKLADIVINVTSGGPGGATDTVSSFIFREYRDRSNVGYGTMIAEVYLVVIIVFVTLLLKVVSRFMQKSP